MKKRYAIILTAGLLLAFSPASSVLARGGGGMGGGMGSGMGSVNCYRYGSDNRATQSRGANARDSDGDGIMNGNDADYVRPLDGTGRGATDFSGSGSGTRLLDGTGPHGKGGQPVE